MIASRWLTAVLRHAGYGNSVHIVRDVWEEDVSRVRIISEGPVSSTVMTVTATHIFTQIPVDPVGVESIQRTGSPGFVWNIDLCGIPSTRSR